MKKFFSLMLLLATILTFTACSDDKDEPGISISKDQLVGIWDATAVQFNNDGKWIDITNQSNMALSIYFYENGDYYGEGALGTGEGLYTLSGSVIKTYVDGKLYATYVINSLVGDVAELSMTMGDESMLVRAKKSKLSLKPNDPSIMVLIHLEQGVGWDWWQSHKLDGQHYVFQRLCFTDNSLTWDYSDYTISDKGNYQLIINEETFYAVLNYQTNNDYLYSYDGKTLVLRDIKTKKETVYSATVSGNTLTLSDGTSVQIYKK